MSTTRQYRAKTAWLLLGLVPIVLIFVTIDWDKRGSAVQLKQITEDKSQYTAAVAIVKYRDGWLLGLSTANDDRNDKWCFPGGGIKSGESPSKAAERECFEELGVRCKAISEPFTYGSKKHVAFVPCKLETPRDKYKLNSEFTAVGIFNRSELRTLKLHNNVMQLIDKVRNKY